MNLQNTFDSPERLQEMADEERSAKLFNITVEQLREQRRGLGQLLTGPYQGCSHGFALMMEQSKDLSEFFKKLHEVEEMSMSTCEIVEDEALTYD